MTAFQITDQQLALVGDVARREGWRDLGDPPLAGGPRSLSEQLAIASYIDTVMPMASKDPINARRRARIGMVGLLVVGLIVCWIVSPERTALGLLVAGIFCLFAFRKSRRRGARAGRSGVAGFSRWARRAGSM
jgi:hypothetical protein